jgi:hypothetical protein
MQRATALPDAAATATATGRQLRISLLLLAVAIAACDDTPVAIDDDDAAPPATSIVLAQASKIGPGVREQILANGAAEVLISLNAPGQPRPDHRGPVDMAGLRGSVASTQASVLADVPAGGLRLGNRFRNIPGMSGRLESEEVLDRLARHPLVVRIQLDVGGSETLTRSVPWIGADRRHANGNDGEGVTVIVMDSGTDTDHPDLIDDIMPGEACFGDWDGAVDGEGFCPNGSDRQFGGGAGEDVRGHGTHVSSIITSNGTVASPGVAPGAGIIPFKVLSATGAFYYLSEIVAAWDYILEADLGARLVNMSFGTGDHYAGDCDADWPAGAAAVATLRAQGITLFAAAGNSGTDEMAAPACLSQVISVGASDTEDNPASFTDSSPTTDVFAPGDDILASIPNGGSDYKSGTSMASPHAAGCAALLIQTLEALSPDEIEARLEDSPFTIERNGHTYPRIDCRPENEPPEATALPFNQSVQYSDMIAGITVTATDADDDVLDATTAYSVNGGALSAGLPAGLTLSSDGCTSSAGEQTCEWTISGAATVQAATYMITTTITDDLGESDDAFIFVVVAPEDATVAFSEDNAMAVEVASAGGTSGPFTLTVYVRESGPDLPVGNAAPGNPGNAVVSMNLVPIGPGSTVAGACVPSGVSGVGYLQVLAVACTFSGVPVNTWAAEVTVGGGYYTGSGDDAVTIFDPSLGFTTGGGWFFWPGTTDRTSFGYSMKYNGKGNNVRGSLLLIRKQPDGTSYRIRSNAVTGMALGDGGTFGWTSFDGRSTYQEPGWAEPLGNYEFLVYAEDRGQSGAGADRFWIQLKDKDGNPVAAASMQDGAPANATVISAGNIVVPAGQGKQKN